MSRFDAKSALVIGAAGGIDAVIVRQARAEGARVAVADHDVSHVEAEAYLRDDLLEFIYAGSLPQLAAERSSTPPRAGD